MHQLFTIEHVFVRGKRLSGGGYAHRHCDFNRDAINFLRGLGNRLLDRAFLRVPRFSPLNLTNDNKSIFAFNLSYLFHRADLLQESMQDLIEWVQEGKIQAPPLRSFTYDKVADAHRSLESGTTIGKLILKF